MLTDVTFRHHNVDYLTSFIMKQIYFLIKRNEPCDARLRIQRFRAGISQRDRALLSRIQFLAKATNCYLCVQCEGQMQFFVKLAHSIYGDHYGTVPTFLTRNVVNRTLREVLASLTSELENCRSVERQFDFQTANPTKTQKP